MTDSRSLVRRTVAEVPGIHFNGLVRRLELAPGQVQHHLKRLRRDGDIEQLSLYGRTHYFPASTDPGDRGALAVCHRETARDILLHLLEHGSGDPGTVAESVGIARSSLEWHLDHLIEQGLVEKRRTEGHRVELRLLEPETTLALLTAIQPTLPERLVDRFSRLVDRLIDE